MHKLIFPFAAALALAGARASAQTWEPHAVTVEPLTQGLFPRLPPDEVDLGDASAFAERLQALQQGAGIQRQDLAIIRVTVRGLWFLSVETVAKEKAAALGANYLVTEASFGTEDHVGSSRAYRAVRLQRLDGLAAYTRSRDSVEGARAARAPAAAPVFQPLKKPVLPALESKHELAWLWLNQQYVLSHRLGVNLSDIAGPAWRDLENTVRVRFPKAEHDKLVTCYQRGSKIILDLKQKTLGPSC